MNVNNSIITNYQNGGLPCVLSHFFDPEYLEYSAFIFLTACSKEPTIEQRAEGIRQLIEKGICVADNENILSESEVFHLLDQCAELRKRTGYTILIMTTDVEVTGEHSKVLSSTCDFLLYLRPAKTADTYILALMKQQREPLTGKILPPFISEYDHYIERKEAPGALLEAIEALIKKLTKEEVGDTFTDSEKENEI